MPPHLNKTAMEEFYGNRLRLIRFINGWSMVDLSSILGISKQAISKYDKCKPSFSTMIGICSICKVPQDFFTKDKLSVSIIKNNVKICD